MVGERALGIGEGPPGERLVEVLSGHEECSCREGEREGVDGGEDAGEAQRRADALEEVGRVNEAPLGVVALAVLLALGFNRGVEAGGEGVVGDLLCSEGSDALAPLDGFWFAYLRRRRTS